MKLNLNKNHLLIIIAVVAVVVMYCFPPIPQDQAYHQFVDQRTLLGIPNFWNVVTNLPFVVVGLIGMIPFLRNRPPAIVPELKWAYALFFVGTFLVGFGSGYYHLDPTDESLVWDRLPMTIAFMAFFAVIIGERSSKAAARWLLVPLLLVGIFSVLYWDWTEQQGAGDLRLYALVQFLPMLLIVILLCCYRSPFTHNAYLFVMLGMYVLAKVFEFLDQPLYDLGTLMSGHAVKHVAAALSPYVFYLGLMRRRHAV